MKFTIDRAALLRPLGHVQSVVERRNTIPILSNVLLRAGDGRLRLTATDMDMDIVESVECEVAREGSATVPAHTFHDIARKLPDGSEVGVEATGDAGRVEIVAGRSRFELPALSADEFPEMSGGDLPHGFVLSASGARSMIDRTRFAISTEETRYYLNGIFLHATRAENVPVMRAVATDGHRLARVEMPLPDGADGMPSVIVPRKAVGEVRKLIDDAEGDISVSLSDSRMCFAFGDIVLTTKLIDGTFPDYERVIPTGNDKTLEVNCKSFAEAVDRVATISTEKSRSIKLQLNEGALLLSASSSETGAAREELEVVYKAGAMEIGFNSRYLLDIANQIEGEGAVFELADPASPTVVRDQDDDSSLYVLMPMRV